MSFTNPHPLRPLARLPPGNYLPAIRHSELYNGAFIIEFVDYFGDERGTEYMEYQEHLLNCLTWCRYKLPIYASLILQRLLDTPPDPFGGHSSMSIAVLYRECFRYYGLAFVVATHLIKIGREKGITDYPMYPDEFITGKWERWKTLYPAAYTDLMIGSEGYLAVARPMVTHSELSPVVKRSESAPPPMDSSDMDIVTFLQQLSDTESDTETIVNPPPTPVIHPAPSPAPPGPILVDRGETWYRVEKITGRRKIRLRKNAKHLTVQYRVKWFGYDDRDSEWKTRKELIEDGLEDMIDQYNIAAQRELPRNA
jgi:hypothetical protein